MRLLTCLRLGTERSIRLFLGMSLAYTPRAQLAVTNRWGHYVSLSIPSFGGNNRGRDASKAPAGSGVTIGRKLSIAVAMLGTTASTVWATTDSPSPAKTSFAYSISHTVKPLPASVIEKIADPYSDSLAGDAA